MGHAHSHAHDCTDPGHHVHGAEDFIATVEAACNKRGLRLTPIRAAVLRLVAEAGKPIKAYDLLERMRGGPGSSAPPTVYRALDFLLEQGFIHRLATINAFLACHHPLAAHTVPILICERCDAATELEDESVAKRLADAAQAVGFVAQSTSIEVRGLCARCR